MAQTKEQWLEKLKSWVPGWFFESPHYQEALFESLAEILAAKQADSEDLTKQTFITQAHDGFLDLHGSERSVTRKSGESDSFYSYRIRNVRSASDTQSLQALVAQLLINGSPVILEDFEAQAFCSRNIFLNRGAILTEAINPAFTIVIDNQTHSPYSFFGREYFSNRSDFIGEIEAPQSLFDAIIATVNEAKAFGVLYRVLERAGG